MAPGAKKKTFPAILTAEVVPLPGLVIPFGFQTGPSAEAVTRAIAEEKLIALVLQVAAEDETGKPSKDNVFQIGGLARIVQVVRSPGGEVQVRLHVQHRVEILDIRKKAGSYIAAVRELEEPATIELSKDDEERIAIVREKLQFYAQYDALINEHIGSVTDTTHPGALADLVAAILPLSSYEAQQVLEETEPLARLRLVSDYLDKQVDVLLIRDRLERKASAALDQAQQEALLREQLRIIRSQLGDSEEGDDEIEEVSKQLERIKMPAGIRREAEKQLRRLRQLHPDTSESALVRTYIDWMIDLPWSKRSKDLLDLKRAQRVLDEDHYGLEETKERVLDYLGVRKLRRNLKGPILLLVGPPGVGKTSLGKSIARALGRAFVRISVGGLRDEAELRGHRRTYVGAMPGRIIQGLKNAGVKNPVFMLDEVDKIGSDFRGDPASVLLEVLDPEQNNAFEDHYLNVPFDLSEVMFICTANVTDSIPAPLLDRMEVIKIAGYTTEEKLQISQKYLVPRAQIDNGLEEKNCVLPPRSILGLINGYTRESGVRELGRVINTVYRKAARLLAENQKVPRTITLEFIHKALGPETYVSDERLERDEVGVSTGLAWTQVGGEILFVEVTLTPGNGALSLTGQLGDVMQESAKAALTYVIANAKRLGIDPSFNARSNLHIHVPQGAIPKDGPSAGVAVATALVSLLVGKPVSRNLAMTGEITLRGNVLAVGGVREKALAALRAGIPVVVIPKANERELATFPKYLVDKVTFIPVKNLDEVLKAALVELAKPGKKINSARQTKPATGIRKSR